MFTPMPRCENTNDCQERQRIQYQRGSDEACPTLKVALLEIEELCSRPGLSPEGKLSAIYMTAVRVLD